MLVSIEGGIDQDCILWQGSRHTNGYGRLKIDGKSYKAHRLVWEAEYGPIPAGMNINHRCDNPPCVNLDHLYLGTQKDNVQDAIGRNRRPRFTYYGPEVRARGTRHGMSKLTDADVREIRALRSQGYSQQTIAEQFNVSQPLVSGILLGKAWQHVV